MASSFKKKSSRGRGTYPAGTKISLHNNQLLISTGVPSMDSLLGGGLAVGTVLLVEEDNSACYSNTLLKCFLAEGVASRHSLFLATAGQHPDQVWKNLPCTVDDVNETVTSNTNLTAEGDNSMKIAWRYENMPKVESNPTAVKFGHFYDFTKTIEAIKLDKISKYEYRSKDHWSDEVKISRSLLNPEYQNLLNSIKKVIDENGHSTSNKELKDDTILRIAIQSLESPLWCNQSPGDDDYSLTIFLYYLRGLLRSSYAACLITIPSYITQDSTFINRVERLCDTVIRLESFAGSEKELNPIYKDYHGLFHIIRLPRLNSLSCYMPETLDLAFKLRRRKFLIEKLHLPPDVSDNTSNQHKDPLSKPSGSYSCGASLGVSKLDF